MTPTQQRKPMPAPITVTAGGGASGPAAQKPVGPAEKKKKPIVAIVGVLALLVIGVGGFFVWKMMNPGPPLPTAPTAKIVDHVVSEKFKTTPFNRQLELMGALDNREDEVEKMYRSGKLSEPQFSMAREAAWLGKNMGRMQNFFTSPPGQQRLDYVKKVVDKIDDVDEPPKPKTSPPEEKLPKRDKKWGKTIIATFPSEVQAQWKEFQKAVDDEQDRRKKERKAAEKAAAATQPATNASKAAGG